MADRGRVFDTYAAALQHGLVAERPDALHLGVVRRPMPWLLGVIDDNEPDLGPPADLLDAVKARHDALSGEGLDDAAAHNRALDAVDYDARYRTYLESDPAAQTALERVRSVLDEGRDVVLVCYENTDEKRCHRTILREYL